MLARRGQGVLMNVLIIAIDTLRADHLGCYGYRRNTSPHLDRLAHEGVVFQCFSPHIPTHPGYTTLFTGKDVMAHQIACQGGQVELDPEVEAAGGDPGENATSPAPPTTSALVLRGFELIGLPVGAGPKGRWRKEMRSPTPRCASRPVCRAAQAWFAFVHYWTRHPP